MTSRRLILLLPILLFALVGGALFLVLGADDSDPGTPNDEQTAVRPRDGPDDGPTDDATAARRAQRPGSVAGVVRRFVDRSPVIGHRVELTTAEGATLTATTGEDGSFVFPSVPPGGPNEVRVPTDAFAPVAVPGLTVVTSQRLDLGTLWLAAGVPVVVEVKTFSGEPLPGASVRAFVTGPGTSTFDTPFDPPAVATAVSDGNGHATFAGLPPGTWTLTAERSGYARRGLIERRVRAEVPEERFQIALENGYRLTGRILDPEGQPVPLAPVLAIRRTLVNNTSTSPLALRTTTDENGRYVFEALPAADVVLWAGWPGERLAVLAAIRLPGVRELDIVLSRGGRFEGRVVNDEDGSPIVGAKVSCELEVLGAFSLSFDAITDADGRCALDFPMPGRLTSASATSPGHLGGTFDLGHESAVELPTGIVTQREVRMKAGTIVSGTVMGPDGPVVNANVGATNPSWWFATQTDSAGRYTLPALPRETFCLLVNVTGYVQPNRPSNPDNSVSTGTTPPEMFADAKSGAPVTVDLRVERSGRVRGQVVSLADAKPIAGARVTVDGRAEATVMTDAEGRFEADGPQPGESAWLAVEAEGYRAFSESFETSANPDEAADHVMRLLPALRVTGIVRTDDGSPLEGAYVQVMTFDSSISDPTQDEWNWLEGERLPVATDGTFDHLVSAVSDTMIVRATAVGRRRADSGARHVDANDPRIDVELVLEAGLWLSGRAVTFEGDPVSGARVQASPVAAGLGADNLSYPGAWGPPIVGVTDDDGRFMLSGLENERYVLLVSAEHFLPGRIAVDLPDPPDVVVELIESREITGRAVYTDGEPVVGGELHAHRIDASGANHAGETRTSADGSFVLSFLQTGTHRLTLQASPESPQNVVTTLVDGIAAGATDVLIEATYGSPITGIVLLPDGEPAKGDAMVRAWIGDEQIAWDNADDEGRFELLGLAPGDVRLTIESDSMFGTGSVEQRGVPAGSADLTIQLPTPSATRGRVIDPDGNPISGVGIMFLPKEAVDQGVTLFQVNTQTEEDGTFSVHAIAGARYRAVMPWDDRYTLERGLVVVGGTGGLSLNAMLGETIRGRVVSPDGESVPEAWVTASGEHAARGTRANASGEFELTGLHEGQSYTLSVSADGWISPENVRADAGARGVSLHLERGLPFGGRVVDGDGRAMSQCVVQLERRDGNWSSSVWCDENGTFRMENQRAGEYDVTVLATATGTTYTCGRYKAGDTEAVLRCVGQ